MYTYNILDLKQKNKKNNLNQSHRLNKWIDRYTDELIDR